MVRRFAGRMTGPTVRERARAAREASLVLQAARDDARRAALEAFARLLETERKGVESANAADLADAEAARDAGELAQVLVDRLVLQGAKFDGAVAGVRAVAAQDDPLGRTVRATLLDDGLKLFQVTVPIGVVACAFESRPDAAVQVASLAMRTGNAVLLKGGSEARRSVEAVVALARRALAEVGLPEDGVVGLSDRSELAELLSCDDEVDLLIPRGSNAFVRFCQDNTRIAVLGHADGVCHVYLDASADPDKALAITLDAKLDYPAACNAVECILVHRDAAGGLVPRLVDALVERGVAVRADAAARALAPAAQPASESDWGHEYGDLVVAFRIVDSLEDAVAFINAHGSGHTDAIVTEDEAVGHRFVAGVDAAGVFVNASTRFADGYRYGLGAEVGISTGKVHARGPVGLEGLTTTKWVLVGQGHLAATYQGENRRPFRHEALGEDWHGN